MWKRISAATLAIGLSALLLGPGLPGRTRAQDAFEEAAGSTGDAPALPCAWLVIPGSGLEPTIATLDPSGTPAIEVFEFRHGISVPAAAGSAGALLGQPRLDEIAIVKEIGPSSPMIHLLCATGSVLPKAELRIPLPATEKAAGSTMTVRLLGARIAAVATSTGADGKPAERLSLTCSRIEWIHGEGRGSIVTSFGADR